MSISPSSSGLLPLPGSPGSSWALYKARFRAIFAGADPSVLVAFWLFGLINNVSYVIILSAAADLVGPAVPKSTVLLADVLPSFFTKLVAPYFIHRIPYATRILFFVSVSAGGMFLIALTKDYKHGGIPVKLFGVCMASLSSGGGELSFLGLTHYYGAFSLAAWGSGTGGAGLIGAGLYVLLTSTIGLSVRHSLLFCSFLPFIMLIAFFAVLPQGPLHRARSTHNKDYTSLPQELTDETIAEIPTDLAAQSLLGLGPSTAAEAYSSHSPRPRSPTTSITSSSLKPSFLSNLRRARALFVPYMAPLLLVYIAEYTINQGVSPTLLFPIEKTPFSAYRSFYPFYAFLYQLGVFISRSSTPFIRIHNLYLPSFLQCGNLALLVCQSMFNVFGDSIGVWIVFLVIFWEGLLGGAVYVNTFAEIMETIPEGEREFSLGATSVSDSAGICIAGFIGMVLEGKLCGWQVNRGRNWCKGLQ